MANKDQYSAQQFIDAIPGTGGIISMIARKVNCDWNTAKKYVTKYATVEAAYDAECEAVLDMAESRVIEMMKEKDGTMLRYYLSTKGKSRGYVERQEVTGADGKDIGMKITDWREEYKKRREAVEETLEEFE